ncbi:MAG: hypothetical protein JRE64_27775 [Deltaproteobacteria bacterium]|nr:hypothetical protein [Deltaproteobacteria bacterium]
MPGTQPAGAVDQGHSGSIEKKLYDSNRKWAKITEVNKYLRVILLEDRETVHNAFFDRSYKEDE